MVKKLVLSSLLAAIVLMVWGFISWALLSDRLGIVRELPNEEAVRTALADNVPDSGVYFFPMTGFQGSEEEQSAWQERHTRGPIGLLYYRSQGVTPSGLVMLWGFLHFWISAMIAGLIVLIASRPGYGQRVEIVFFVGFFAAFSIYVSDSVWWYVPWSFTIYAVVVTAIGWTLAGLVLGKLLAPRTAPAAASRVEELES